MLRELDATWQTMRDRWHRMILLADGADDFYINADPQTVQEYRQAVAGQPRAGLEPTPTVWQPTLRPFEVAAIDVYRFFVWVGLLVLDGSLHPKTAYGVLGTEVARRSRPVRALLAAEAMGLTYAGTIFKTDLPMAAPVPPGGVLHPWAQMHPGIAQRVAILLDVLWAEAAVLEDLGDYDLAYAATVKEVRGTGRRNRRRALSAALRLRSPIAALRLTRRLRRSEWRSLLIRSACRDRRLLSSAIT